MFEAFPAALMEPFSSRRKYLAVMLERVFSTSANQMCAKLEQAAVSGKPINMEAIFNQLTLDVIGKAVFNYDFNALNTDSPVIQVNGDARTRPPLFGRHRLDSALVPQAVCLLALRWSCLGVSCPTKRRRVCPLTSGGNLL